jgi:methenyltetrahydrofolate cyclohydrolase
LSARAVEACADLSVRELLDALEHPSGLPAGGTAAALAAASAASVVAKVARGSPEWADGGGVAAQARRLRARLVPLADTDAEAFAAALGALAGSDEALPERRNMVLARALTDAAEVPLAIAEAAADVAALALLAAEQADPRSRADAVVAAALAEGATAAAAGLVDRNLATRPSDERSHRAAEALRAAVRARALATEIP